MSWDMVADQRRPRVRWCRRRPERGEKRRHPGRSYLVCSTPRTEAIGDRGVAAISPPQRRRLADQRSVEMLRRFRADRRAAEATRTA